MFDDVCRCFFSRAADLIYITKKALTKEFFRAV